MSAGGRKKPSISTPSIYVALAGKDNKVQIKFPKSMETLKSSVTGIFHLKKQIIGFYSDDGYEIFSTSDIIPGSVVYVSTSKKDYSNQVQNRPESAKYAQSANTFEEEESFNTFPPDSKNNTEMSDEEISENSENSENENIEAQDSDESYDADYPGSEAQQQQNRVQRSKIPVPKRKKQPTKFLEEKDEVFESNSQRSTENDEPEFLSSTQIDRSAAEMMTDTENQMREISTDEIESIQELDSHVSIYSDINKEIAQINEEEDEEEDDGFGDSNQRGGSKKNKGKRQKSKSGMSEQSAYGDNEEEQNEEEDDEEEEEEGEETLYDVIEELVGKDNHEAVDSAYQALPKKVKEFYDSSLNVEQQQNYRYMSQIEKLLRREGILTANEIQYEKEINKKALDFIDQHHIHSKYGPSYTFQTAIVGPRSSGKSTLLAAIIKNIALELATTGMSKHYFLFFMNMNSISLLAQDVKSLYKWYVNQTFALLFAQAPFLSKWSDLLISSFHSIVDSKASLLSKRFILDCEDKQVVQAVQGVFDVLKECWNSTDCFSQWLSNVLHFPRSISRAFGFSNIIYAFDHFDASDLTVDGRNQFEDTSVGQLHMVYASLIDQEPYILGTANIEKAVSIFSCGLDMKVELLSTCDIIEPEEDNHTIHVYFEEEDIGKHQITNKSTGGVPYFNYKWKELMACFDKVEEMEQQDEEELDDEEHDDAMAELVTLTETYICLAYKLKSFTVSNVVRKTSDKDKEDEKSKA